MNLRITTKREDLIDKLSDRTAVYESILETVCPTWATGSTVWLYGAKDAETLTEDDSEEFRGYYIEPCYEHGKNRLSAKDLPTEFFNHQLMECDTTSPLSVDEFISAWGLPLFPQRLIYTDWDSYPLFDIDGDSLGKLISEAQEEERTIRTALLETPNGGHEKHYLDEEYYISLKQAVLTIRLLQAASRSLSLLAKSTAFEPELGQHEKFLNFIFKEFLGTCSWTVFLHDESARYLHVIGSISEAIVNQMLDTIKDDIPWRECACKGCGTVFKRKQTRKGNKPASDSIYCCDRCEEKQKKRNQRATMKRKQAEKAGGQNG